MKLTETREFEDFVVKMARECDGASTALGRETLGRETCAAARALLEALDREKAKTEPPKIISCRKCHTLRAFGDDYCMCGGRSWYVASTEPPKRTADMVHPNDGSAPCEQCGQGTKPPRKKGKP